MEGQLGGEIEKVKTLGPKMIREVEEISKVACGENFSVFLDLDGNSFGLGDNSFGQLGNASNSEDKSFANNICEIACGDQHTLLLGKSKTMVFACGNSSQGRLGVSVVDHQQASLKGKQQQLSSIDSLKGILEELKQECKKNIVISKIGASEESSFAITSNGILLTWGINSFDQLGHKFLVNDGSTTTTVEPHQQEQNYSQSYRCASCNSNSNDSNSDQSWCHQPSAVASLWDAGIMVKDAALGSHHSIALSLTGNVYTWFAISLFFFLLFFSWSLFIYFF